MPGSTHVPGWIDWALAGEAYAGGPESGDHGLVRGTGDGALLALVDGLGHGPHAACASLLAIRTLEEHAGEPLARLIERCDEALRDTRGAAITLVRASAEPFELRWLGVGNVESFLLRADSFGASERCDAVVLRGGVVGYRLPALRTTRVPLSPGDTLVMATDGIRSDFARDLPLALEPAELAHHVWQRFGKATDDALVLVARFGEPVT